MRVIILLQVMQILVVPYLVVNTSDGFFILRSYPLSCSTLKIGISVTSLKRMGFCIKITKRVTAIL